MMPTKIIYVLLNAVLVVNLRAMKELSPIPPLHQAALSGNIKSIAYYLKNGTSPNQQDNYQRTAGHAAAENGKLAIIKLLKESGADFTIKNLWGKTALDVAKLNGYKDIVSFLSKMEIDSPDRPNLKQITHSIAKLKITEK